MLRTKYRKIQRDHRSSTPSPHSSTPTSLSHQAIRICNGWYRIHSSACNSPRSPRTHGRRQASPNFPTPSVSTIENQLNRENITGRWVNDGTRSKVLRSNGPCCTQHPLLEVDVNIKVMRKVPRQDVIRAPQTHIGPAHKSGLAA